MAPDDTTRIRLAAAEKRLKNKLALAVTFFGLLTAASGAVAIGYRGGHALDGKADAKELQAVSSRVTAVETSRDDDRHIIERIESKLDWLIAHPATITGASKQRGR